MRLLLIQSLDISVFEKHIHPDDRGFVMEAIAKAMDPDGDTSYNLMYRNTSLQ
jgi:hypothetical protein